MSVTETPLVNRLQRTCTFSGDHGAASADSALPTLWESLPSIAVVGGQSSGKSSVLESIVGRDFLPRGSGIVTRRPLVLQLQKAEQGKQDYAEFLHLGKKRFTDFSEVRKEIQVETDRVTGRSNRISNVPIHLSIYSPNVVNLTLIDLPGLTKVAVEGQPECIVEDIKNMVRSYVEKPNCIILAVTPANQDVATSDAVKLAREVDPKGERTFGVLTKLDLMDRGTNALDVLEGKSYRLKHPWVGIVNRSQADINTNMDMIDARRRERDYFSASPEYGHLASRMGSEYLAKLLSKHLESVIKDRIPRIASMINKNIDELESELDHLVKPVAIDAGAQLCTSHSPVLRKWKFQPGECSKKNSNELALGKEAGPTTEMKSLEKAIEEYLFSDNVRPKVKNFAAKDYKRGCVASNSKKDPSGSKVKIEMRKDVSKPIFGDVLGVQVGDGFNYRIEMRAIGLHRPLRAGIDCTKYRGQLIALSVVASHEKDELLADSLTYTGEGGEATKSKEAQDQKLERGNLALKNSVQKNPVRVIRRSVFREKKYFYDGLYMVESYGQRKVGGRLVFKFRLRRISCLKTDLQDQYKNFFS